MEKVDKLVISQHASPVEVDMKKVKNVAMAMRAINHGLRQTIIRLLDEQKRLTVTEIYKKLNLEQSVASQHLAILRRAGFVKTEREGKFIFYCTNRSRFAEVAKVANDFV